MSTSLFLRSIVRSPIFSILIEIYFDKLLGIPFIAPDPRGKTSKFTKTITLDTQYLSCLDDVAAQGMMMTLLHEILHYNQSYLDLWLTGPNHDRFDDQALRMLSTVPKDLALFNELRALAKKGK
jgi:hypothetical protein